MDLVSVIMPCHNEGRYIKEAICSVKAQTYPDVELIIIDDGSNDDYTLKVLDEITQDGTKVIRTKKIGPSAARNAGIAIAQGKYILPVDSDDKIEPNYISKAVNILENNPDIGVVYCYADLFGEKSGKWELPNYSFDRMLLDNIIFVSALFYKSDWEKVGGFNTNMHYGMEDYDFWLSIIELGREIYQIPEILFHYRIKNKSRSTIFQENKENVQQTYREIYLHHKELYKKYAEKYEMILREAWIDQLYINRSLKKGMLLLEKLNKFPLLKKIIKKIFLR